MQRGDVIQLGRHRIMCGDAGDPDDVAKLFAGATPDLVFTSPPYLQQRVYGQAIVCWDTLMQRVFGAMPHHPKTQVLVNLGLVHRDGEWQPYWDDWIEWMRKHGWRRFGWYVWDKGESIPGDHNGRLAPCFEWVFHMQRERRYPNKTRACKRPGAIWSRQSVQRSSNNGFCVRKGSRITQTYKIDDAVLRICPEKGLARKLGHPAVFPVSLPKAIHAAYSNPGSIIYDPFAGSGTSLVAAEAQGRVCYAMEIEPAYCDIILNRFGTALSKSVSNLTREAMNLTVYTTRHHVSMRRSG